MNLNKFYNCGFVAVVVVVTTPKMIQLQHIKREIKSYMVFVCVSFSYISKINGAERMLLASRHQRSHLINNCVVLNRCFCLDRCFRFRVANMLVVICI